MSAFDNVKKKFSSLKPTTQRNLIFALIGVVGVGLASGGHMLSGGDKKHIPKAKELGAQPISNNSKILEATVTSQVNDQKKEMEELRKQMKLLQDGKGAPADGSVALDKDGKPILPGAAANAAGQPKGSTKINTKAMGSNTSVPPPALPPAKNLPAPPPVSAGANRGAAPAGQQRQQQAEVMETAGDIEIISAEKSTKSAAADKKKAENQLYMPSGSFMEATLLNGLYAPTSTGAKGDPTPVLIRIKTLSQLPNRVKSDLKGCFVIASAVGNLSDERAHLRLTNLSCITKNGEAVIDQDIKGFVTDSDGFLGLRGRVVAKLGSTIARSLIAGFFGGVGEGLKSSTQSNTLTALGSVSSPVTDPGKLAMSGAGQGLSDATKQIQKFYLDLAKQSIPVVEILPRKKVTMVLSKGVKLNVKPLRNNN